MKMTPEHFREAVCNRPHPEIPSSDALHLAAVAFLLDFQTDDPELLAILKAPHPSYPWGNQVALPGGHVDADDADDAEAALRELEEELGIPATDVDLLGTIGDFMTIRNVRIAVMAGIWNNPRNVAFDSGEIAEVLRIPVTGLLDAHMEKGFSGRTPSIDELLYPAGPLTIWGATARIVHHFLETLLALPEATAFTTADAV